MNISVIGSGYVGLCTGVVFAAKGHIVTCVDIDKKKVDQINSGSSPIFEEKLDNLLKQVLAKKLFSATTDLESAVGNSQASFIAVGTPSRDDGSIDLTFIETVARQIGTVLKNESKFHTIVVKSTVLPGTTENLVGKTIETISGRTCGREFGLSMSPEFLREGKAVEDALHPSRIVIGSHDKRSGDVVAEIYRDFGGTVVRTDLKTAEMIKYASNAFLATKISFINEIGNVCKKLGINTYDVAEGMGLDDRIGRKFLDAGCGFGGSCFGKDTLALLAQSRQVHAPLTIVEKTVQVNEKQPARMIELLKEKLPQLKEKRIALLGLTFKPGTDDIRDAPSLKIIAALRAEHAHIVAHDPKAGVHVKKMYPDIILATSPAEAVNGADACLIVTDWPEYKSLTDKDFDRMKTKIIIEGRKTLNPHTVSGFEGVCW